MWRRWWFWVLVLILVPMALPYIGQTARDELVTLSYVLQSSTLDPYVGEAAGNAARERWFIKQTALTKLLDDIASLNDYKAGASTEKLDVSALLAAQDRRAAECGDEITARSALAQKALRFVRSHRAEEYSSRDFQNANKWKSDLHIRHPSAVERKYLAFALQQCAGLERLDPQNGAWLLLEAIAHSKLRKDAEADAAVRRMRQMTRFDTRGKVAEAARSGTVTGVSPERLSSLYQALYLGLAPGFGWSDFFRTNLGRARQMEASGSTRASMALRRDLAIASLRIAALATNDTDRYTSVWGIWSSLGKRELDDSKIPDDAQQRAAWYDRLCTATAQEIDREFPGDAPILPAVKTAREQHEKIQNEASYQNSPAGKADSLLNFILPLSWLSIFLLVSVIVALVLAAVASILTLKRSPVAASKWGRLWFFILWGLGGFVWYSLCLSVTGIGSSCYG